MEMSFYNTSNQLTFSADGYVYSYLGRANATGLVQPGTNTSDSSNGYSTYTFNWNANVIAALPLKSNGSTVLLSSTQTGSTWNFQVYKSNGTTNSLGFENQEYTEVYLFGAPQPGTSSSFMLYDVNGNPTGDLSRRPLTFNALLSLSASTTDNTWVSPIPLGSQAIIGSSMAYRTTSTKSGVLFINQVFNFAWMPQTGPTSINRKAYLTHYSRDDGNISVTSQAGAANCIITSIAGL